MKGETLIGSQMMAGLAKPTAFSHKEIRNIQMLRFVAALLVVFCHLSYWEWKYFRSTNILPAICLRGEAGVDIFFVISGFIMVYIQPKRLSDWPAYRHFILNRLTRIFPPYWIVSFVLLLVWMVKPTLFNSTQQNQVDIVRSFLLLPQSHMPLLLVGWTLIHELYFYFIVSFALVLGFRGRVIFGIVWGAVVVAANLWLGNNAGHGNRFLELCLSPFSLTFLMGYFVGLFHSAPRRVPIWIHYLLLLLGIAFLITSLYLLSGNGMYPDNNDFRRFFMFGLPPVAIIFALIGLEESWRGKFSWLERLGNSSYSLYLVHAPLLVFIYLIGSKVLAASIGSPPLVMAAFDLFALGLCLLAGLTFHLWVELPSLQFARKICGLSKSKKKPPA